MTTQATPDVAQLRRRLNTCPPGHAGWQEYQDAGLATLIYLFVPPLMPPRVQPRTLAGTDRRDAIFPNRIVDANTSWGLLYRELSARLVLIEFKNYDRLGIGKDETDQVRNYMKPTMGRLAMICCNKPPQHEALARRNQIYSLEGKVILFLTTTDLMEMLDMKGRGEDPAGFVVDSYETFLIEHE